MAASAAMVASAAGFAAGGSGAVLGQPLDFVVQVRLEAGETLQPDCVAADVMAGERRLPASQVQARIEDQAGGSARIRVVTTVAIEEPVIGINLGVGCQVRLSRNYIVLADPPHNTNTAKAPPMVAAPAFAVTPADADKLVQQAADAAQMPPAAAGSSTDERAVAIRAAADPVSVRAPAPPRAAAPAAPRTTVPRATALRATTHADAAPVQRTRNKPTPALTDAPAAERVLRVAVAEPPARLRLDFVEPAPSAEAAAIELALEAVAEAASAARAQAAAASAAAARMAALERQVERLGGQAQASRDEAALLRAQLENGGSAGPWLVPLTVLVALLAALTAWLAWRLSSLQRHRQQGWQEAVPPPPRPAVNDNPASRQATSPIPFVTSEVKLPAPDLAESGRRPGTPAWPPVAAAGQSVPAVAVQSAASMPEEDEPAKQRTERLPPTPQADDSAPRDVSIEELIDLEQQAEFFSVLGQDEAAVDLLMQHLRDTGGGSPLPYLKLLEIHRRGGDRSAYERMRVRFNQRFNAYAPDWEVDLQAGRSLEDYAGVVPRLQQVWSRPLDAMAELEALLFRKSRGEFFDLPAYREVLFLYALARDLLDHDAVDSSHVDLLLPLADGGEFSTTAPAPFMALTPDDGADRKAAEGRPTSPVDLDLTQSTPPGSIFDTLNNVRRP